MISFWQMNKIKQYSRNKKYQPSGKGALAHCLQCRHFFRTKTIVGHIFLWDWNSTFFAPPIPQKKDLNWSRNKDPTCVFNFVGHIFTFTNFLDKREDKI